MRVTNVGGSLTTALVLSLVAWGVRYASLYDAHDLFLHFSHCWVSFFSSHFQPLTHADYSVRKTSCVQLRGRQSQLHAFRVKLCTVGSRLQLFSHWCAWRSAQRSAPPQIRTLLDACFSRRIQIKVRSKPYKLPRQQASSSSSFKDPWQALLPSPVSALAQSRAQVNDKVLPCTLVDVRSPEEVAEAPVESFGIAHRSFHVAGAGGTSSRLRAERSAAERARRAPRVRFLTPPPPHCAEAELPAVMRPRGKVWEERFEQPLPSESCQRRRCHLCGQAPVPRPPRPP